MTDDVTERLMAVQPLPRGERLARIAGVFVVTETRRELMLQWSFRSVLVARVRADNSLSGQRFIYSHLWQVAARALNSEQESLRMIAYWRAYAAPLRRSREKCKAMSKLFFDTAADNQEKSAAIRRLESKINQKE